MYHRLRPILSATAFVLEDGTVPLALLRAKIERWIAATAGK